MKKLIPIALLSLLLVACSDTNTSSVQYEEVKKIMIDLIQTEDGKKTLRQVFEEPSFREILVLEHDEVKQAIEQTLLSEEASAFWKKTLEDPKFKESFAKSIKKEQTTIQKDLMKDATYQEELIKFFGQPDMQKQFETILKGATIRKEIEKVVKETFENPLMQSKWEELIRKSGESSSSSDSGSGSGSDSGSDKAKEGKEEKE